MTDLDMLGGTTSFDTAINPQGKVVGFSSTAGTTPLLHPTLW